MIPSQFDDFFTAAASVSGALIGLLFVAISVAPERAHQDETRIAYQVRASAALLVFCNALFLSLAALVPGVSLGWWSVSSSVGVVAFAFAGGRTAITEAARRRGTWLSFRLVIALLVVAGFEIFAGVELIRNSSDRGAISTLDYVVVGCLAVGINRAWELMSMRDTGVFTSLRVLAKGENHPPRAEDPPAGPGGSPSSGVEGRAVGDGDASEVDPSS